MTVIPIVIGALGTVGKRIGTKSGRLGDKTRGDYQNYSIVEIGLNTEKGPGELRRLPVI